MRRGLLLSLYTRALMKWRRLLYDALIVPSAHTRVFDATFQLDVYEVFHTHPITRWAHLVCTPIVNISLLAAATVLPHGAPLAALIALSLYCLVQGWGALLMIPVLAVSVGFAYPLAAFLGGSVPTAFAIAYAAAFAQTLSHGFEPVPPPWSGSYRFITLKEFLFRTPPLKLAGLVFASALIFPVLEFWASPRIWPVQIVHLMMRAGMRPALARRTRRRVLEILSDARKGWALPPI